MDPALGHDPLDVTRRATYPTAVIALGVAGSCNEPTCCDAHLVSDQQFLDAWLTTHAAMTSLAIYPPPGQAAAALRRERADTRQCPAVWVEQQSPRAEPGDGHPGPATTWPAA